MVFVTFVTNPPFAWGTQRRAGQAVLSILSLGMAAATLYPLFRVGFGDMGKFLARLPLCGAGFLVFGACSLYFALKLIAPDASGGTLKPFGVRLLAVLKEGFLVAAGVTGVMGGVFMVLNPHGIANGFYWIGWLTLAACGLALPVFYRRLRQAFRPQSPSRLEALGG